MVERLRRCDRDLERPRIGVADVLGRADDQPPGDEPRILAGRDHRGQPVQRRVRIVAAQALDERRDRVVVPVAGAVVREDPLLGRGLDVLEPRRDVTIGVADSLGLGQRDRALQHVERRARVPTGQPDQVLERVVGERDTAFRPERARETAFLVGERPTHDRPDLVVRQRLEPPDAHPREQRGVHLEVRVLRRRADERDRAVLDVGEQRVLLRLVEPMDLVEEQHRARPVQGEPVLGLGDRARGPRRRRP